MLEFLQFKAAKPAMEDFLPKSRRLMRIRPSQLWLLFRLLFVIIFFIFMLEFAWILQGSPWFTELYPRMEGKSAPWALTEQDLHSWNLPKLLPARYLRGSKLKVDELVDCNPVDRVGVACCGHIGAPMFAPENTILSFLQDSRQGGTCVEMDIHLTRDSQLTMAHSRALNEMIRKANLSCNMTLRYEMSLAELKRVDLQRLHPQFALFNSEVPSLLEVFEALWKLPVQLVLELKVEADHEGSGDLRRVYVESLLSLLGDLLRTKALGSPVF